MTRDEHLDKIVAKCRELLALAEKRTPGQWKHRRGEYCSHWISRADNLSNIAEIPTASNYTAPEISQNADYIAACSGRAEAGCRATIVAIDELRKQYHAFPNQINPAAIALNSIIAAWPEELL